LVASIFRIYFQIMA